MLLGSAGACVQWYAQAEQSSRDAARRHLELLLLQRQAAMRREVSERIGDVTLLSSRTTIRRALETPDRKPSPDVVAALRSTMTAYGYSAAMLVDAAGRPVAAEGTPRDPALAAQVLAASTARPGPIISNPFRVIDNKAIYLVATAISGATAAFPQGAVLLERDATALVSDLLRSDDIRFPSLRLTPADPDPDLVWPFDPGPTERATAAGPTIPGPDTPAEPPVATISVRGPPADGPWRLVAQIEAADALAELRNSGKIAAASAAALAALAGLTLQMLHGAQQRRASARELLFATRFDAAIRSMADGFMRLDPDGRVQEANTAALAITGRSLGQIAGRPLDALAAEGRSPRLEHLLPQLQETGSAQLETRWRRGDGVTIDVAGSATLVPHPGGGHIYLVLRDVTAATLARQRLERVNNLRALHNHGHRVISQEQDPESIVREIGRAVVVDPHIVLVWTGWIDREAGIVRVLSANGTATGYVENLSITLAPESPNSRGPTGRAATEGVMVTTTDLQTETPTAPWHVAARAFGLRSSAAVPLLIAGEVVAVLTLYSDEPNYFEGEVRSLMVEIGETISIALEASQTRRMTERIFALTKSNAERLHRILTASPVPMLYTTGEPDEILTENDAFQRLFGYPQGHFRRFGAFLDEACVDQARRATLLADRLALRDRARSLGAPVALPELALRCADGSIRLAIPLITLTSDDMIVALNDVTELRAGQLALRRREAISAAIFEQAADAILLVDAESATILEFNTAAHTLFGYDRDGFAALTTADLLVEPDGLQMEPAAADAPGPRHIVVHRHGRHRLGHLIEGRVSLGRLEIDGRNCVTAIFSDITAEQEIARKVAAEAEKHRVLFTQAAQGIGLVTPDGLMMEANASLLAMLRLPQAALPGRPAQEFGIMPPPDADHLALLPMQHVAQLPVQDAVLRRHDGSQFDAAILWSLADLPDRRLLYCSIVDATEIKRNQRELARINANLESLVADRTAALARQQDSLTAANADLSAIFEGSPIGIAITKDRLVLRCNRAMEAMFGLAPGEAIGTTPRRFYISQQDYDAFDVAEIPPDGEAARKSGLQLQRKDGSRFWASVTMRRYRSPNIDGGILVMIEDVTAEFDALAAIEKARHQAEIANRAKSTFLASMSHEIRTPLNGVIGMSEILAREKLPPGQAEAVEIISSSARGLMGLIDDILDFSKIEADHVDLEHIRMSLTALVEGACDALAPTARAKGVDISVFLAPAAPDLLLGDPTRVRQILHNVIGNAVKFSGGRPERRGRVAVRVEVAQAEPLALHFSVTDNGIGMDQETVSRLFTPFTQADRSTTRRFGGTGLGLAITSRLLTLMGGRVSVSSEPGKGSCFRLTIPFAWLPDQRASRLPDMAGLTAIIVTGQDLVAAEDLKAMLDAASITTHIAPDVAGAVALAEQSPPPVVVLRDLRPQGEDDILATASARLRPVLLRRDLHWRALFADPAVAPLDLGWLRRLSLLRAVAFAAGRLSREALTDDPRRQTGIIARTAPSVAQAQSEGRLILLAEDDDINRKVVLRQLDLLGYAAEFARDGQEALERWRSGRFGLVLTDIAMPVMDGYQLTEAIRAAEAGGDRRTPVLALSANALRGEAELAREHGFDAYLTKPILLLDLQNALQRHLAALPQAPPQSPPQPFSPEPAPAMLDRTVLAGLVGDDAAIIDEFLASYAEALPPLTQQLESAARARDTATVAALAHRLKSSSRAAGALRLGALCAELEQAGKASDQTRIDELLCRVQDVVAALLPLLPAPPHPPSQAN